MSTETPQKEPEFDKIWKIHGSVLLAVVKALRCSNQRDLADELEKDGLFNLSGPNSTLQPTKLESLPTMLTYQPTVPGPAVVYERILGVPQFDCVARRELAFKEFTKDDEEQTWQSLGFKLQRGDIIRVFREGSNNP